LPVNKQLTPTPSRQPFTGGGLGVNTLPADGAGEVLSTTARPPELGSDQPLTELGGEIHGRWAHPRDLASSLHAQFHHNSITTGRTSSTPRWGNTEARTHCNGGWPFGCSIYDTAGEGQGPSTWRSRFHSTTRASPAETAAPGSGWRRHRRRKSGGTGSPT
jgi:hypothetical protein